MIIIDKIKNKKVIKIDQNSPLLTTLLSTLLLLISELVIMLLSSTLLTFKPLQLNLVSKLSASLICGSKITKSGCSLLALLPFNNGIKPPRCSKYRM